MKNIKEQLNDLAEEALRVIRGNGWGPHFRCHECARFIRGWVKLKAGLDLQVNDGVAIYHPELLDRLCFNRTGEHLPDGLRNVYFDFDHSWCESEEHDALIDVHLCMRLDEVGARHVLRDLVLVHGRQEDERVICYQRNARTAKIGGEHLIYYPNSQGEIERIVQVWRVPGKRRPMFLRPR